MTTAALSGSPPLAHLTPRAPNVLERAIGALVAAVPTAIVLLDPHDGGAIGPIVTPVLVAIPVFVGALIAGGPRGRARVAAAIFGSNRRYLDGRRYILTTENTDRLARLGRALGMVLILLFGALVCFAKPIVTLHLDRDFAEAPPPATAFGPRMPAELRAELEAAASAGDPEAIAVLQMMAPPRSSAGGEHFTITMITMAGYTSERNVAWPITGGVLLLVALALVLTRGGLTPAQPVPGARS